MLDLTEILRRSRIIAILGAHDAPARAAFYVPDYLHGQGYTLLPVNPALAGRTLWGRPVTSTLVEAAERAGLGDAPIDLVDVFRRPEALDAHLPDLLALSPPPRVVWLQSGIRNDAFAARLTAAGIDVVQDRCTLGEHRARRLPPVGAA